MPILAGQLPLIEGILLCMIVMSSISVEAGVMYGMDHRLRFMPLAPQKSRAMVVDSQPLMVRNPEKLQRLRGGSSIEAAITLKNSGNTAFREKNFEKALRFYNSALLALPRGDSSTKERINCLNNRAACHVKLADFASCIMDCTEVLEADPSNGLIPPAPRRSCPST